jgi:hypothetical protein
MDTLSSHVVANNFQDQDDLGQLHLFEQNPAMA